MITVKMVRDYECDFVDGDLIQGYWDDELYKLCNDEAKAANNGWWANCYIKELAWRNEEFPNNQDLIIEFRKNGTVGVDKIANVDYFSIDEWRPSMSNWTDCKGNGAKKEIDWQNGDKCEYKNEDDEWNERFGRYVCFDEFSQCHVFSASDGALYYAMSDQIRKPETQEQKEAREKEELIKEASEMLTMNGFAHDPILLRCLHSHGYLVNNK